MAFGGRRLWVCKLDACSTPSLVEGHNICKDGDYHTWEHRVDLLIAAVEARCRDQELLPARIPVCLTTTERIVRLARTNVSQSWY